MSPYSKSFGCENMNSEDLNKMKLTLISVDQDQKFEVCIDLNRCLGEGGNGEVYLGNRSSDNLLMAVKYMRDAPLCTSCCTKPREVCDMIKCKGVGGVIQVYGYCALNIGTFIAMEYLPGWIDLYDFLGCQKKRTVSEDSAKVIFTQLVYTMIEMTGWIGLVHGDLKSENVLINPNTLEVKVFDLGSTYISSKWPIKLRDGTSYFYPPEHFKKDEDCYYEPTTVWALGCILFELVVGDEPFKSKKQTLQKDIDVSRKVSGTLSDLLRCILDKDQMTRMGLMDILSHPWML